jgi:acyl-CoA synthetase (AMP-forming)/AMP-acid ligase II
MTGDQNRISMMGTSILSRFIECSTQCSDNPAIFVDDRSYTYGELNGLCSAMCALLKAHDIKKGDRVGIFTENNIYTHASLLGILSCGACYVPLNYDNPVERNMGIIADAGIKVLLYTEKEDKARELSVSPSTECRPLNNRVTLNSGKLDPVDQMHGDLCYLLFTSGERDVCLLFSYGRSDTSLGWSACTSLRRLWNPKVSFLEVLFLLVKQLKGRDTISGL